MAVHSSILSVIGNTPLVHLPTLSADVDGELYVKLEYLNPGFSKKDRSALSLILDAEERGMLAPGQPVIELTSGNMGTGLAIVCRQRGYPFTAIMSRGNSIERAGMMRALGAEVILVEQAPGSIHGQVSGEDLALVEARARELCSLKGAFRADQFAIDACWRAHYDNTMPEILRDFGGAVDAVCDFVGSGSSLGGMSRYIKDHNLATRCYAIEPEGAEALYRETPSAAAHPIQGGGYSMPQLALLDTSLLDGSLSVSGAEAVAAARELADREGVFAGFSTGANLAGARKLLAHQERGSSIAFLACDSGLKYLSTDLWSDPPTRRETR